MRPPDYDAAWVPDDDPPTDGQVAAELAVDWILAEAEKVKRPPLLVVVTRHSWQSGPEAIRWFGSHHQAATPRGTRPTGGGPVLAYAPDYDLMDFASALATGSSLAVVESQPYVVSGWAMETGAVNLLTGQPTGDTRTEAQTEGAKRIAFYGNNGWTSGFGKTQTTRILDDMRAAGTLDRDIILGYVVAHGSQGKAVKRLAAMIDALER